MTAEMIAAIVAVIALMGSMITVWLNLNLKIKELSMKIIEIEHKIIDFEKNNDTIIRIIEKNNERIWQKLDLISEKLDEKFNVLTVLKTEHDQIKNNCLKK